MVQDFDIARWRLRSQRLVSPHAASARAAVGSLLAPHMARRIRACAEALATGGTAYLQHGWPVTAAS